MENFFCYKPVFFLNCFLQSVKEESHGQENSFSAKDA